MKLHRSIAVLAVACGVAFLASPCAAQRHIYTFHGDSIGEFLGFSVRGCGDVNRDGFGDVILGGWGDDKNGIASGSARVISGKDGSVLHHFTGAVTGAFLGYSVNGAGDIDKDGYADLLVGAVRDRKQGVITGSARVLSGKTGQPLFTWWGARAGELFGHSVSSAGDVDKDGTLDVIVGAPMGANSKGIRTGYARVHSGKDGRVLLRWFGHAFDELFGYRVAGLGDINGDGFPDLAVGTPHDQRGGKDSGSVQVFSGKDGKRLYDYIGAPNDHAGRALSAAGDVNKDGRPDFVYGGEATLHKGLVGRVRVVSGRTGKALYTLKGSMPGVDEFSMSVGGLGDINGDGYADIAVGAPSGLNAKSEQTGYVRLFSGKDGKELATVFGTKAGDYFGYFVANAGDVNGDGVPDVIVGADLAGGAAPRAGYARVISGRALALTADRHTIGLGKGGSQTLSLATGAAYAGKVYLVLGSNSGTRPGIRLGSITLPLNPDVYFSLTLGIPNAWIRASLGRLDGRGDATASLQVPPGLSSALLGTRLYHAFVVLKTAPTRVVFASNAAPLTLVR